ncbi:MAG TPA: DUF3108 domain-containing protein [Euryarchaeota archaeon]|nr:DUF3108 domain-containing protein [Euryarchaeota archaeon]
MKRLMIKPIALFMTLCALPFSAIGHPAVPGEVENGISFHYRVQKLGTTIITASLSIEQNGPLHVVKAAVDTTGMIRPFFQMHNRFCSYVKDEGLEPLQYVKKIDQRGVFSRNKRYTDILTFDPHTCTVTVEREDPPNAQEITVPPHTYDPLSIFLKCFLESEVEDGQTIGMRIYDGIKLREVTFAATSEEIPTPLYGEVQTICLESEVPFSSLGDKEGAIKIWYTDDERRFPVNITLELPSLGSVEFELERVEQW